MTPLARTIAVVPEIKDWEHLSLDATGARLVHDLSLTDWREWMPHAVPPFERCTLTLNPEHYLLAGEADTGTATAIVFLVSGHGVSAEMHWGKEIVPSPLALAFTPPAAEDLWSEEAVYGWGPEYVNKFGIPVGVTVGRNPLKVFNTMPPDALMAILRETAGQVRMILAALALINQQQPDAIKATEPTRREGRALYKGRSVPNWTPRLVVLRPDAPRPSSATQNTGTGTPKRDHSVRRHLRRYKSGRTVWVRSHRRGDETLGTVEKTYLIEADPNKGLHNGPPEGAS